MKEMLDEAIKMGSILRTSFPEAYSVSVTSRCGKTVLTIHTFSSYSAATEAMRALGVGERQKNVFQSDKPMCCLEGDTPNGIAVEAYVSELPPTCRLEKFTEKIPKTKTVDTGDFVEVERTKIVCDSEISSLPIAERTNKLGSTG